MGIAGDDQVCDAARPRPRMPAGGERGPINPVNRIARPEFQVGDNLIVAASPGVQFAADVAELVDQGRLDVHVDVFALENEREIPSFDFSLDFRQSQHNLLAFVGGQKPHALEHASVRGRALDVVLEETTIKGDRFRELFHAAVGSGCETTTPGLLRPLTLLPAGWPLRLRKLLALMTKFRHFEDHCQSTRLTSWARHSHPLAIPPVAGVRRAGKPRL